MLARAVVAALALALLTSCEAYKRSNLGTSATEKTVLYDFRDSRFPPPPKLDAATERKVFLTIAPNYLADSSNCLKARARNTPVLHTQSVVDGAFTAPGVQETAHLVQYMTCVDILRSSRNPSDRIINRLVILAGDRPVTTAELPESTLLKSYDLNRDGKHELLLASGYARMGGTGTSVRLVQFEGRNLATIENFGSVYDDNCGFLVNLSEERRKELPARGVDPVMNAVVLSYLPRPNQQMPSFTAQRFRAACPAPGQPPHWLEVAR